MNGISVFVNKHIEGTKCTIKFKRIIFAGIYIVKLEINDSKSELFLYNKTSFLSIDKNSM